MQSLKLDDLPLKIKVILSNNLKRFPITDEGVKLHLLLRNEPATIANESKIERIKRLKRVFHKPFSVDVSQLDEMNVKRVYIEGSEDLKCFRENLHRHHLENSAKRSSIVEVAETCEIQALESQLCSSSLVRTMSLNGDFLILGSLNDSIELIRLNEKSLKSHVKHFERNAFPNAIINLPNNNHFIVGQNNGEITVFSFDGSNESSLSQQFSSKIHSQRVNSLAINASKQCLLTTSHDETFKLLDVSLMKEVQTQHGHGCPVYCGEFNNISSHLLATGDLRGIVKLWDNRITRNIANIAAHVDQTLNLKWHPQIDWLLVSSGADGLVKFWDLRMLNQHLFKDAGDGYYYEDNFTRYIKRSHSRSIRNLQFEPDYGRYLVSLDYAGKLTVTNPNFGHTIATEKFTTSLPNCFQLTNNSELFISTENNWLIKKKIIINTISRLNYD